MLSGFSGRVQQLGSAGLRLFESRDDLDEQLFPVEQDYIRRAVPKRFQEFQTVRALARRGLAELGRVRPPMVPGERGEPIWPQGIIGSITHCDGYRAVMVSTSCQLRSIGIDAEPNCPLSTGVFHRISSPEERDEIRLLAEAIPQVCGDRLLFSAKESIYKMWFPVARNMLWFDQACVRLLPDGSFDATLLVPAARSPGIPRRVIGRWDLSEGILRTMVDLPHASICPIEELAMVPAHLRDEG
ncbi:4'-phosphopantetheinyl transferase family protein [Actinomyces bowdenii]|uniref:4'-phosphopantetheinyl transferase superfamily protein n=1 Tax=Actinomyces bowdenii TaxID=131109 RepID=A0A853EFU8_9ACTO|nr:4'-phosphopantetheinyl transferase superfamily protein [Actinomyces bowdenii]MBF0695871.1 4'-phosphopantetheinyl transferase superfamily protein [Actinomyces bowdenii]MDO5092616.1 4'-phosphopantetheinyl transferase superfamily protein [Propionibacteriaceae bacterium]NYS68044.1 4'-phosphopantetheinyl transferase superfamily protein [Actinomyces bowdenii]